mgnify:CR=1 FL=1
MHNVIVFCSQFQLNTIKVWHLLYVTDEPGKHDIYYNDGNRERRFDIKVVINRIN